MQRDDEAELARLAAIGDLDDRDDPLAGVEEPHPAETATHAPPTRPALSLITNGTTTKKKSQRSPRNVDPSERAAGAGLPDDVKARITWGREGPATTPASAIAILTGCPEWHGVYRYNERSERAEIAAPLPVPDDVPTSAPVPREVADTDDVLAQVAIERAYSIAFSRETISAAVDAAARGRSFDPVRDFLDSLTWDREDRADRWLVRYLGAEDSSYTRAIGRAFLVAAVVRAYEPGAKVDYILVFEGDQGDGKSSACRILARRLEWFSDALGDVRARDTAEGLLGNWIVEIGELAALRRADTEAVKAFVTRNVDRYRLSYGRRTGNHPRRCVFIATTNERAAYLVDATGNRRWWPVRVGKIDLAALERDADQLWAEARTLYRAGCRWWPDAELARAAADEQARRHTPDPWHEQIERLAERAAVAAESGRRELNAEDVLRALDVPTERQTQTEANRVARVLSSLDWERTPNPVTRTTTDRLGHSLTRRRRVWQSPPTDGGAS